MLPQPVSFYLSSEIIPKSLEAAYNHRQLERVTISFTNIVSRILLLIHGPVQADDLVRPPGPGLHFPFASLIKRQSERESHTPWPSPIEPAGCMVGNLIQPNCSQACFEPTSLFSSRETLANCVTLGAASLLAKNASIIFDDLASIATLEHVGVGNLSAFNGAAVLENLVSCAIGGCKDSSVGQCDESLLGLKMAQIGAEDVSTVYRSLLGYCDTMENGADMDIAGPGIILSYIIQASLVLWFFMAVKFFTCGPYWSPSLFKRFIPSSAMAGLVPILIEFQEVQAFFITSVQVATLITFRDNCGIMCPSLKNVSSFSGAITNSQIIQILGVNGIIPVLLTQLAIQRAGIRSLYHIAITIVITVLAEAIHSRNLVPDFNTLWEHFQETQRIDTCGGNPSPRAYCTGRLWGDDSVYGPLFLSIYRLGYFVVPLLIFDVMLHGLELSPSGAGRTKPSADDTPWPWFIGRVVSALFWYILQVLLFSSMAVYFTVLVAIFKGVNIDSSLWTYGQIVAVLLWVPMMCKHLYFRISDYLLDSNLIKTKIFDMNPRSSRLI